MASIDQSIAAMYEKNASAIILETGRHVMIEMADGRRALTKDMVSTRQIVSLVREVLPEGMRPQLDGGEGRLAFSYLSEGHTVDIEVDRSGQSIIVVVSPAKPRRSSAAISMPAPRQ